MPDIQKLILATLAYYDLFDFPLTTEEIKKYLVAPRYLKIRENINIETTDAELYSLTNTGVIELHKGFYTLPDRDHLIPIRIRRTRIAKKKMQLAQRVARLLSFMPYVQAVFASGSLALENTDYDSDLDLFIITKSGRIWTARFIINSVLDVLGLKRKPKDKIAPNKICPNHLIADNALTITNQNIFTAKVYSHLVPIYVRSRSLLKNFQHDNQWINSYICNWSFPTEHLVHNFSVATNIKYAKEAILNTKLGKLIENLCRKYQKHRIEKNPLTHNPHGRIEYDDNRLEFHPHSIENSIVDAYNKKLKILS